MNGLSFLYVLYKLKQNAPATCELWCCLTPPLPVTSFPGALQRRVGSQQSESMCNLLLSPTNTLGGGGLKSTLFFVLCTECRAQCLCQACRIDVLRTGGAFILPSYLTCCPRPRTQRPKRCTQKSRMSKFWHVTANEPEGVRWRGEIA